MSKTRCILATVCATLLAGSAGADDFDRRGWFAGAGFGVGASFLSEYLEQETNGVVEIQSTGSLNVRGGYRLLPWLALASGSECFDDLTTEGASCCFSMQGDDVPAKLPVKLHEVKQGSGHDADLTGAECSVSASP